MNRNDADKYVEWQKLVELTAIPPSFAFSPKKVIKVILADLLRKSKRFSPSDSLKISFRENGWTW